MKDISVIINAHDQGQFLYRTVRAFCSNNDDIKLEILCILSNATVETLEYAQIAKKRDSRVKLVEINSIDLGVARNIGTKEAKGEYLLFLNAGDIVLHNSLRELLEFAKKNKIEKRRIFTPLYLIEFNSYSQVVQKREDNIGIARAKEFLFFENSLKDVFLIKKKEFEEIQYEERNLGYNIELLNWDLFAKSISQNGTIQSVPRTVVFVKQREESQISSNKIILEESEIFNYFKETEAEFVFDSVVPKPLSLFRNISSKIKDSSDHRPILKKIASALLPEIYSKLNEIKNRTLKRLGPDMSKYPNWLLREWGEANEYENFLNPHSYGISEISYSVQSEFLKRYDYLMKTFSEGIDYVIFCPWINTGGADKLTINLARGIAEIFPESKIGLITTEIMKLNLPDDLPLNIKSFSLGELLDHIPQKEKEIILFRFLKQIKVKRIINVNSDLMFRVLKDFGDSLSRTSELYAFCFSASRNVSGQYVGYTFEYIPFVIKYLKYVLTDNKNIIDFLTEMYGFNKESFRFIYQPIKEFKQRKFREEKEEIDILWASRIDYEKLPDVLEKITKESNDKMRFHIFGGSVLDSHFNIKKLSHFKNSKYYGSYSNGLKTIPDKDFDVYLYTSAFDGMPNTVLEAIALGIPVVASNIGGIHEIITDEKSGFLVNDFNNHLEYLEKIKILMKKRSLLKVYSKNAQRELMEKHSWNQYINNLKEIFN